MNVMDFVTSERNIEKLKMAYSGIINLVPSNIEASITRRLSGRSSLHKRIPSMHEKLCTGKPRNIICSQSGHNRRTCNAK